MTQSDFAKLDYSVMRCAFESQNEMGRLCDEAIYRNDLAARLSGSGLGPVRKEVPVTVEHRGFRKTFRMDLLVGDGAIYELKAEARLVGEHESQLLNYLFLFGAFHGKLVNFRPAKVESRFVNTRITAEARRSLEIDVSAWRDVDDASRLLRNTFLGLLEDWGGFLELALYLEALTHFLGGEKSVVQMVPLQRNGIQLGNQRFHLASLQTAFRLTALTEGMDSYAPQLRALLHCSPLRTLQWINLAHHGVHLTTLTR